MASVVGMFQVMSRDVALPVSSVENIDDGVLPAHWRRQNHSGVGVPRQASVVEPLPVASDCQGIGVAAISGPPR